MPRLYPAFVLLAALALAAPARAQPREQTVADLAFAMGQSHALRQLCQGATDQYWRERMQRMTELEAPDPADRRAKLVSLTPQGRTAAEGARDMLARVDALWAERLSPRDYATLKRLLARITDVS